MVFSKKQRIILAIMVMIVGGVVYFSWNPAATGFFPPCVFHQLTGYQCPGCGTQRAIHSWLHLDFIRGFRYNPLLLPALLLIWLLVYLEYFGGKRRFPKLHRRLSSSRFIYLLLAIILLYWLGRNFLPLLIVDC